MPVILEATKLSVGEGETPSGMFCASCRCCMVPTAVTTGCFLALLL